MFINDFYCFLRVTSLNFLGIQVTIAAIVLVSSQLGWAAAAVGLIGGLGSLFFSDRENKVRDARRKMEYELVEHIDEVISDLKIIMKNILYDTFLKPNLYSTITSLNNMVTSLFTLSKTQRELAMALNTKLKEINIALIAEALDYLGFTDYNAWINDIARIPGYAIMLVIEPDCRFPDDMRKELSRLLKEDVYFIVDNKNMRSKLAQAIGKECDRELLRIQYIDNEPRIAHIAIPIDQLTPKTVNRVKLAQQLTDLLVMK